MSIGAEWRRATASARRWQLPARPTVVVVPHPDDESLSAGGLIAIQRRRGLPVTIVAVTDGEAAYPDMLASELADRRRGEQAAALARLGGATREVRCSLPDGRVEDHLAELEGLLGSVLEAGDLLVAPWTEDHHCDHIACARAAVLAATAIDVVLVGSLFWAYHHTPPSLAAGRLLRLDLDRDAADRRAQAIAEHRSQLPADRSASVLSEALLAPARGRAELYVSELGDFR